MYHASCTFLLAYSNPIDLEHWYDFELYHKFIEGGNR